jgi:hypothetical protein
MHFLTQPQFPERLGAMIFPASNNCDQGLDGEIAPFLLSDVVASRLQ